LSRELKILLLLMVFSVISLHEFLFSSCYPKTHGDLECHVTDVWYGAYSLKNYGRIIPWAYYYFTGFPVYLFYPPLSHFLAIPLALFFSPLVAIKIVVLCSFIVSSFFAYKLAFKFTKRQEIAIFAAFVVAFYPYHLFDIEMRGAYAETIAIAFIAPFLYQVEEFFEGKEKRKHLFLMILLFSAIVLTNIPAALVTGYFFLILCISRCLNLERLSFDYGFLKKNVRHIFAFVLFSLSLTAFFIVPVLMEMGELNIATYERKIFVQPFSDLYSREGGMFDTGTYVGLSLLLLSFFSIFSKREFVKRYLFSLFILLLLIYTPLARYILFQKEIEFSFRFYTVLMFVLSVLSSAGVEFLTNVFGKKTLPFIFLLVLIDFYPAIKMFECSDVNEDLLAAYDYIGSQEGFFRTMDSVMNFGVMPIFNAKPVSEGCFSQAAPPHYFTYFQFSYSLPQMVPKFLGLIGIKYFISKDRTLPGYHLVKGFGEVKVYENENVRPFAWCANLSAILFGDDFMTFQAPFSLASQGLDLTDLPIITSEETINDYLFDISMRISEKGITLLKGGQNFTYSLFPVQVSEHAPDDIELTLNNTDDCFLVVQQSYNSNWHVYLDGKEVEKYRAFPNLISIHVPAGNHVVRLKFKLSRLRIITSIFSAFSFIFLVLSYLKKLPIRVF